MKFIISLRSIVLSLCIFLLSLSANALIANPNSNVEFKLAKLHYSNSRGEKGITVFDYNSKGHLDIAVWHLLDGSRISINYYDVNEDGNVSKNHREFSDGTTSTKIFSYNKAGKLTYEEFSNSDEKTGTVSYKYNSLGDPEKAICQGLNGWFYGTIEYTCDARGNKIKGAIIQSGKRTGMIEYTYDVYNSLVKEVWRFGTVWSQNFNYEYEPYDSEQRIKYSSPNIFLINNPGRVKKENYDYSNENGGPSEYFYNNFGKLEKKTFERSDGLKTVTRYLYSNKGKPVKAFRSYSNKSSAVFTFEYDSLGRLSGKTFIKPDSTAGSEMYIYSEEGKLAEVQYKNMDMWLSGVITFEHDEVGKIIKGNFVGENNFNAEIDFSYNLKNQLTQIFWQLTDGRTQTYTFEY
ncbi:MAG: hypothetical protein HND52_10610 [Ignavibacteriae bacterium]|nr:hypothetical protein [Ignavibacteriota bacterium]